MSVVNVIKGKVNDRSVTIDDEPLSPELSQAILNHSPDGFSWGYGGSGPAQLALAILLKFTSPDQAIRLHQQFKWAFITGLPYDEDFMLELSIEAWIRIWK